MVFISLLYLQIMVGGFENHLARYRKEIAEQGVSNLRDKLTSGAIANDAKVRAANRAIQEYQEAINNQTSERQEDREQQALNIAYEANRISKTANKLALGAMLVAILSMIAAFLALVL